MRIRFGLQVVSAFVGLSLLCGCMPRVEKKQAAAMETPLPAAAPKALAEAELNLTATVLDEETGQPIADAWFMVTAHVTTEPPSEPYEAVAANRGRTGADGVARFNIIQGVYRPQAPRDRVWKLIEEARARRIGERKITGIAGGSILVVASKYGLIHQPFAVEDSPTFQDWLKKNPGRQDAYGGWLGRDVIKENLKTVFIKTKDLSSGVEVAVRIRKPATTEELVESFRVPRFMQATWSATSRQSGASEEEQLQIYGFFASQMDEIADETKYWKYRGMFETYMRDESINYYIGHALKPDDMDGSIQLWLAKKALEILPRENEEVKRYALEILKGVADEGKAPVWQNHYYDLSDPDKGLSGNESALKWGAIGKPDNSANAWDWHDCQRYYREGDKAKAYEALGHVLRLLTNLSIPKYTQMRQEKESEFEKAITNLLKANGNNLPPEYYLDAKNPKTAADLKERFDSVASQTLKESDGSPQAPPAGQDMRNGYGGVPWETTAKKTFPSVIEQAVV